MYKIHQDLNDVAWHLGEVRDIVGDIPVEVVAAAPMEEPVQAPVAQHVAEPAKVAGPEALLEPSAA